MKNKIDTLYKSNLFNNISVKELEQVLGCLGAKIAKYTKGSYIFLHGDKVDKIGIVLTGELHIIKTDYYGNENIMSVITKGNIFAESAACGALQKSPVDVLVISDSEIVFIDYNKLTKTCANSCSYHTQLIKNMITVIADKNLMLTTKVDYLSKRLTRDKLLAYLFDQSKLHNSKIFKIPFNREQLANYLSVDRSAMSNELSKLARQKIIKYYKNQFELL